MISADSFEMIETLSREALAKHPVWAHFRDPEDRARILAWGVSAATLDAEVARLEYCGTPLLFPVIRTDPLPPIPHLIVAASFECADGTRLPGYLIAPHAFGLYVGDRELCFNRNLAGASARAAAGLGAALGREPEQLFPLRYTSALREADGSRNEGEIPRFW